MTSAFDFSGRNILITGAASGIGAATARWLDREGAARLILVDKDASALRPDDLGCESQALSGDVGDWAFWDAVEPNLPPLDHAVINAGVSSAGLVAETSFEDWRRVLSANLDGAFLTLRTVLRTISDGGSVVLTASVSGFKAEPGTAAYGSSKAGMIQLAKVAAREAAARRIRVNVIAPGGVDTAMWDSMSFFQQMVSQHDGDRTGALAAMAGATPLGKFATADQIAGQIGFLLSDLAADITGATLVSDGGYSA